MIGYEGKILYIPCVYDDEKKNRKTADAVAEKENKEFVGFKFEFVEILDKGGDFLPVFVYKLVKI